MGRAGRRVVVTGMGMITPVGLDAESSWQALCEGRSGVGPVTLFDAAGFATRIAGEVTGFRLADYRPDAPRWREHSRTTQFALAAATLAVRQAGLAQATINRARFGVCLGSGEGEQDFGRFVKLVHASSRDGRVDTAEFVRLGREVLNATREADQEPGGPAGHLAAVFGARGPNVTCQTACAASAQGIGEASEFIRRGTVDVMLAGGTHSMIHPLGLTGFILLTAMSTRNDEPARASRPFDRDRDGFVLGEGGGVLVLEELEHAQARGAAIFGEVAGHCSTADAFRLTDSHHEGRGAIAAMNGALADAGADPEDVDYINAHGTSTPSNDSIETLAIKRVFGDSAYRIPISSTKSMTGHLVSAGGAVEAIACLHAIRDGVLPPTINLEKPDPECDLDYVPNQARERRVNTALSNSFGFGGQNTTLVLRRFAG
jgi:3-oxoacyl-[acyl-carrier-protein] synthase II